jgi:hypothetical protein
MAPKGKSTERTLVMTTVRLCFASTITKGKVIGGNRLIGINKGGQGETVQVWGTGKRTCTDRQ